MREPTHTCRWFVEWPKASAPDLHTDQRVTVKVFGAHTSDVLEQAVPDRRNMERVMFPESTWRGPPRSSPGHHLEPVLVHGSKLPGHTG